MARAKRLQRRSPEPPPSKFLAPGTYAVYDGVEVRLSTKGQGWELWSNERTAGFTRDEYGRYVRRVTVGDPLELECFRLEYHGTYRGITIAVQSPEGPVMAWTNDSKSVAEGFRQVDRGEYRKTIPLDDPDLRITTTQTPLPMPWRKTI